VSLGTILEVKVFTNKVSMINKHETVNEPPTPRYKRIAKDDPTSHSSANNVNAGPSVKYEKTCWKTLSSSDSFLSTWKVLAIPSVCTNQIAVETRPPRIIPTRTRASYAALLVFWRIT
jgi:hypothetical protein